MTDYVVVGGGVYGCGIAWEMVRRGADVLLLEANTIAAGASGGAGKRGVRANGRDLRELPLMRLAYERWPTLHTELKAPTGYERVGHLLLIERDQNLVAASARAWVQEEQGVPTRLIDGDELRALEPFLSEDVIAALYCTLDGVADHTATTLGMATAAQRHGAEIHEQCALAAVEKVGGRVRAVIAAGGERIEVGKKLILLSNGHGADFVKAQFGVTLPVWHTLPQVVFTEPVDPMPVRHLIGHAHRTLALKAGPNGNVMISGGWRGRWNAQTKQAETIPDQVAGNVADAVAVYPCLAGIAVATSDASRWESMTHDGIPIIDEVPGTENVFIGTGWCGHGWAIAPAVIQLIAEWMLSGNRPELLQPFSYRRFVNGG